MKNKPKNDVFDQLAAAFKNARRSKGLSLEQGSLITRFSPEKLEELEYGSRRRWGMQPFNAVIYLFEQYGFKLSIKTEPLPHASRFFEAD